MERLNYWKHKNVLVTGCTGFIGSWLSKSLVELGANVTGLIRDWIPDSNLNLIGFSTRINTVRGNLTDYELMLRVLNEFEVDTVFHLAAQTIVRMANRSPLSTFESNLKGTWNLLEAARRTGTVKRLVVASSDKAYGAHKRLPYKENFSLQGRHPYDVSKSFVDMITQSYYYTYGMPVGIARCGNIFGGGDLNFNRIIPETIRSLYYNEHPVIRSDGSPVRDYVYIDDCVNAYLALARALDSEKFWGEAFNFSNEEPLTVLELVERIIKISGKTDLSPKITGNKMQIGEIHEQFLSSKKAREILSWEPAYTIDDGLKETLEWYNAFFEEDKREPDRLK